MTAIRPFALARSRGDLIAAVTSRGWRVVAASAEGGHKELGRLGAEFRHVPYARGGLIPRADATAFGALRRVVHSCRPALVHAFQGKPSLAAWAVTRGTEAKLCLTVTGLGRLALGSGPLDQLGRSLYAVALRRADLVVFQNPDDRDLFARGPERTSWRLIPGSGVDTERFLPRGTPRAKPAPVRVLMLARLIREKGVLEFLEAAKLLRDRGIGAHIQLGGEWDTHPSALDRGSIKSLLVESRVEFVGYVDDVKALLPEVDIVVLPSYREGMPRTLLEGGACGAALVATDVSGCREVVKHEETGLLVPPRDPVALADAIERLVRDADLRRRLGAAARERVVRHFSMVSITQQYLDCYAELVPSFDAGAAGSA